MTDRRIELISPAGELPPMTEEEFAAVKARCEAVGYDGNVELGLTTARCDACTLLREVERLRGKHSDALAAREGK